MIKILNPNFVQCEIAAVREWENIVRKRRNIGLLEVKHPYFCLESTELLCKEVRCFHFPKSLLPTFIQELSFPLAVFCIGSADYRPKGMPEWKNAEE